MNLTLAKLSLRNLLRRRKRSWLTIIGIVIGITAVVALISIGQGLETSIEREFEEVGTDIIYILPGSGLAGFTGMTGESLGKQDLDAVRRVQGLDQAGPLIYEPRVEATFRGDTANIPLVGIPTDSSMEMAMEANALEVETGRALRSTDGYSGLAARSLQDGEFEDDVGLRGQIEIRGERVRIVGLLEPTGDPEYDRSVFIPVASARDLLGEEDRTDFIVARPLDGVSPENLAGRIEEAIRNERGLAEGQEDFTVSTADDLLKSFFNIIGLVQVVVLGIVSIALVVGGLGIMNTMYMAVSERTKEIGIMKSVGATRRQIMSVFLMEAGVLGLIGGVVGVVLGFGLSEAVFIVADRFTAFALSPSRSPLVVLGGVVFAFLVGVIAGFFPARKAARLEPVEAIRDE